MNKYWATRNRDLIYNEQLGIAEKALADQYIRCFEETQSKLEALYDEIVAGKVGSREGILASDLYRYNRYYDLLNELNTKLSALGQKEIAIYDERLTNMYKTNAELIANELRGSKFNTGFSPLVDEDAVRKAVNATWCGDGKHWSDRVWTNKAILEERIKNGMVDAIARGCSKDELVRQLLDDFNVGFRNADRIARTELSYIQNQATKDRYEAAGVQKYQVLTTHDDRTCDASCAGEEGKQYLLSNAQVGVNYPPFHPNCRCTVLAVLD